jgi:uncharacterized protein (DUF2384 family)
MTTLCATNKELLELRENLGCSQEKLSQLIGVSLRTVVRWEAGDSCPNFLGKEKIDNLIKILEAVKGIIKKGKEKEWFNMPHKELRNRTPLDILISTPGYEGVQKILNLLGSLEYGIPV